MEYFKSDYIIFKKFLEGPFILIRSLQRIVSVILELILEKFKIGVVTERIFFPSLFLAFLSVTNQILNSSNINSSITDTIH